MNFSPIFKTISTLSFFFLLQISNSIFAQSFCTEDCFINETCGDLTPVGGLCEGSSTFFCEGETVCVTNTSLPGSFDEWVVWWDEGDCDTYPSSVTTASHVYDIPQDTCLTGSFGVGKAIYIKNIKYCGPDPNDYSLNCIATFIKIKVSPVASFNSPPDACIGVENCFVNSSCANADTMSHAWTINGAFISNTLDLCHTFQNTGSYEVCLEGTNECGTDVNCHTVNIIDPPIAQSSFFYVSDSCAPATVLLHDESIGEGITIDWDVIDSTGFEFPANSSSSSPDTTIILQQLDTFSIIHVATNACGADSSFLSIPTYDLPEINISPEDNTCGSFLYSPEVVYGGSVDLVEWVINNSTDTIIGFNPSFFLEGGTNYTIEAFASGPCGVSSDFVNFTVLAADSVAFLPVPVLCANSDAVPLSIISLVTGSVVPFSSGTISCIDPSVFQNGMFFPENAGIGTHEICFEIIYSPGCSANTSITITVAAEEELEVGGPDTICINQGPFPISFSPSGGVWSGPGITDSDNGIFDPLVAGTNGGTYNVLYIYEAPAGCTIYKNKSITVTGFPSLVANDISTCQTDMDFNLATEAGLSALSSDPNLSCFINGVENCSFNPSQLAITTYEVIFIYTAWPGCSISDTISLEISELQNILVPMDTTVCPGDALTLIASPMDCNNAWSGSSNISANGVVNTNGFTGQEIFTVTCDAGTFCENSEEVIVTVVDEGAVIATSEDWVCQSIEFYDLPDASPVSGNWSGDQLSAGNVVNIANLQIGDYNYEFTETALPDACESASFLLHITPAPEANFSHEDIFCVGDSILFTNLSTAATEYNWNFGDLFESTEENPNVVFDTAGDFTITLEATTMHPVSGDVLCSDQFESTIHISGPPDEITIGASQIIGCGPMTVDFSNLSIGEDMDFEWYFINLDTINEELPPDPITFESILVDTAFYDIILKGWTLCDTLYDTLQVAVLPNPTSAFGVQFDEPCSGGSVVVNNLSLGNADNSVWTITNLTLGDVITYNEFNPPPITVFAPDSIFATVVIQLETSNDCGVEISTDTILVPPSSIIAQMNFSAGEVCQAEELTLINISTPGTDPNWEINLSNGDSYYFNSDTVVFAPPIPGPFDVVLVASDGCGFDSLHLDFVANDLPEIMVTYGLTTPCLNESVYFEVESNGNGLDLNFGDGSSTDLHISNHYYSGLGTFPLSATVESALGCVAEWTDSITIVNDTTDLAINVTNDICANESILFAGEGTGVQSWEWTFCDDDCPTIQGQEVDFSYVESGIHNVQLVGLTPLGCKDTVITPVLVNPSPTASFDFEVVESCIPAEVLLTNTSENATAINWEASSGELSLSVSDSTSVVNILNSDVLSVILVASNNNACFDTAFLDIPIDTSVAFQITQEPNCTVSEGMIISVETEPNSFISITGAEFSSEGNYYPHVPAGEYIIEVLSASGCSSEEEIVVLPVQELSISLAQYIHEIELGEEVTLEVNSNLSNVTQLWSPPSEFDDSTSNRPAVTPLSSSYYTVAVTNENGCIKYDTAQVQIRIDRDKNIFIPNTFTPNEDGNNDLFRIRSLHPGLEKINSFEVFDRFGEKVFEAFDCLPTATDCGWDGTFRGQKAEMGSYIWMAELKFVDGVEKQIRGGVSLIR